MDHHKGPRKDVGKPRARDLHPQSENNSIEYWKTIA
jgi:hypothetical protein